MKTLDTEALVELEAALVGAVFVPGRPGYDDARRVYNGLIDRRPAAIARCADTTDVVTALKFARGQGLDISIRSGGHGVAGSAVGDGVLTIDLSAMRRIDIDPVKRVARVEAGVTWGDLDAATQKHGLAVTGGRVTSTGVARLTLGSGSGWLERTIGFTCDNLLSAEVVTAKGDIVVASNVENADLFWGIRGGGGNFGIVTKFEFRLHPIGPTLLAGTVIYPLASAREVLRGYRDFMEKAPDQVGGACSFVTIGSDPSLPPFARGKTVVSIVAAYFGPLADGETVLAPLRRLAAPALDRLAPMAYVDLQRMNDGGNPAGMYNYFKADFVRELNDAAIDVIVDQAAGVTSPRTALILQPLGGALARVPADSTPLGRRDAAYAYHALSCWVDDDHERHIAWTKGLAVALQPFATTGVYLTYIGEEGEDRVREAYGPEKYARLVALKDRYDPTNLFNRNQNIRPSGRAARGEARPALAPSEA
jgi:FAD/FMN-containing dehydrogenase